MDDLIPRWLGIVYGALIVLGALGPLLGLIWRSVYTDFSARLVKVEERSLAHEHELYGIKGTNGMKGDLDEECLKGHKSRSVLRRALSQIGQRHGVTYYQEGDL